LNADTGVDGDISSDASYVYPSRSSEMISWRVKETDGARPCGGITLAIVI
jgi:hypothetical protein